MASWKGGNMAVSDRTGEIAAKINALEGYKARI